MRVQVVKAMWVGGKQKEVGDVLDLGDQEARSLILMKKAVVFVEPEVPQEPDNREKDIKTTKRTRKAK